jgi:two-component system, response regulator
VSTHNVDILLVEDNSMDIELALHALHKENVSYGVQVVRDGEEALNFLFCREEYWERSPDRPPRLIVLDLKVPKVDGLEVLRIIKADARTRAIPWPY